jgi:ABC-type transport system substrate-binding protein
MVRVALVVVALLVGCTNDPYPEEDDGRKIVYIPFETPTKTLDPAVAYTTVDHAVTGPVYDTLLEYHYLERPYRLIPGLARTVPEREVRGDRIVYRFHPRRSPRRSCGRHRGRAGSRASAHRRTSSSECSRRTRPRARSRRGR